MLEQNYTATLLADTVVTADAATAGGHQGLDYLPGSLFLGAAVAQAMRQDMPFDPVLFLSGRVRFLDALPTVGGLPTHAVPFCFHQIKGRKWAGRQPWSPLCAGALGKNEQPTQWRRGYMTVDGVVVTINLARRIKTAIDRELRRCADGQLFGYESIPEGTVFQFRVQADDEEYLQRIDSWFAGRELRLGRSRSAEYGAVRLDKAASPKHALAPMAMGNHVVLYLASDLALVRDGQPALLPDGADFGLVGADLVPEQCFLRPRRYSPWNAFFNSRMSERQVLAKGGVIVFRVDQVPDLAGLQECLAGGVGLFREEGLGQVLVNPPWLLQPPVLREPPVDLECDTVVDPKTPLTTHLREKARLRQASGEAFRDGLAWAEDWFKLSRKTAKDDHKVPSKSQWSAIREQALRSMSSPGALPGKLDDFCGRGLRRKIWVEASVRQGGRSLNLLDAIKAKIGPTPDMRSCLTLHHAAVEMGRKLARENDKKGERQS